MPHSVPKVNPWVVACIVSMATFMEVLDTSIVNVALRYIAGDLGNSYDESTWTLTTYLVSNAVILPASGWLSNRVGRKRFYMVCVGLFTISSFFCGIAPNLMILLFSRVAQGIGGGGLAPSEQAILTDTFPPNKRGAAFALYGVAVVVAPAVGPALGGYITDHFSWRWIFFLNIPVGLLSLFLTYHFVPEEEKSGTDKKGKRIDYLGFGLIATGLGCLQVVLDRGQIDDWFGSPMITTFAVIAGVALLIGLVHELTVKDPIVALPLMRNTSFFVSNIVMFFVGIVLFATTQLIPQLTQDLFGYDATNAGLTLSPGGFFVLLMMPIAGFLVSRVQPKYLIMFGFLTTGCAMWYWTNLDLDASFRELVFCRVIQAGGLAFLFVPINTIAYSGLPPGASNDASALINLMRNYGGSVGVSIVQTMVARRSQAHQTRLVEGVTNVNPVFYQQVHGPMHRSIGSISGSIAAEAEMLSFLDIFKVLSLLAFAGVFIAMFLKRMKPGEQGEGGH